MSTNECDNVLAKLIDTIVSHEKQVDEIKVELANNEQFSPFSTFRRINTSETGFLNEEDLITFFRYYGFSTSHPDVKRLLSQEKQKSSRITYNDFLNQVLPRADLDLRHDVLERVDNGNVEVSEPISRDIGRLITAIYRKEIEFLRLLEVDKKRLVKYDVALIEVAFLCLADDITPFLSYKSIATFMKQNGFHFGKVEYESFMRRIDKDNRGRISVPDFKYILYPYKSLTEANNNLNGFNYPQTAAQTIEGISPIKSVKNSPNKNNTSYDSRNPRNAGDSIPRKSKNSFSPIKHHENDAADIKIPSVRGKGSQRPSQVTFNEDRGVSGQNFYSQQNRNIYQTDQYMPTSSRYGFDNQDGEGLGGTEARNPMENRFLDPKYNSYWDYNREHNTTLSPQYLEKGNHSIKSKKIPTKYFNPNFLEPASYQNYQRYPDNPFRHTDHGHYFQNYYNGLRSNYYDQYYNFVPYQTKIGVSGPRSSASKSRASPAKSYVEQNEVQSQSNYYNQPNTALYQSQIPEQENSFRKSPIKQRASATVPADLRSSTYSGPNHQAPLLEHKVFPQSQLRHQQYEEPQPVNRSAIKIDSQGPQRSSESLIDTFLIKNQPYGDDRFEIPDEGEDAHDDNKPYKYVVVHV